MPTLCIWCENSVTNNSPLCDDCIEKVKEEKKKNPLGGNAAFIHAPGGNFSNGRYAGRDYHEHPPQPPIQLQRPDADFSPSERIRVRDLTTQLLIGKIITGLGFFSTLFTITGTNIFNAHHLIPDGWAPNLLAISIAVLLLGVILFIRYWLLKRRGYYETFGGLEYLGNDGALYIMLWRRRCPWCKGVMHPKMVTSRTDPNQAEAKWVCQENQSLHVLDYDRTEIAKALRDNKVML